MEETFMPRWFISVLLAVILSCGGPSAISPAAAASAQATAQHQASTDLTARRHHDRRHRSDAYHPNSRPYYYDRPHDYAPAPFFPLFGLGYGPWW
jgi:hypothetical protein